MRLACCGASLPMNNPRRSAAVILHRDTGRGLEVYLVKRSAKLRHWGGQWAFPGGVVEPEDAQVPLAGGGGLQGADPALIACASRELREEVGVCVTADASRFRWAVRLITPHFSTARYETTFFLVETSEEPRVVDAELTQGVWRLPKEALDDWRLGRVQIVPPVLDILDLLGTHGVEETCRRLRSEPPEFELSTRSIRLAPGYEVVPVESPPLPVEIPVNVFLVGWGRFVLVDPAPRQLREREQIFSAVDRRRARGDELLAIVLTHHHPDHVGALEEAVSRYKAPVWAHAITGNLLGRKLDRALSDGAEIDLGLAPDGQEGWRLKVLFTPGHAEGHIALLDERHSSLIAGDLVSTLVSMYVGSPGGNLREYFASLERVRALSIVNLYPSHGAPSRDPGKLVDDTLEHRRARVEEVLGLLASEPQETRNLALRIYPGGLDKLRPLFVRSTRAALERLVEDGRAERCGVDSFRLSGASAP